ncbi:hypothetical protein T484DRAFT_1762717 [Baffinella frigidus]|nr:hypothetical protein T484DRAFT_1762717 [Cryptophyta sp. CCMP2293]
MRHQIVAAKAAARRHARFGVAAALAEWRRVVARRRMLARTLSIHLHSTRAADLASAFEGWASRRTATGAWHERILSWVRSFLLSRHAAIRALRRSDHTAAATFHTWITYTRHRTKWLRSARHLRTNLVRRELRRGFGAWGEGGRRALLLRTAEQTAAAARQIWCVGVLASSVLMSDSQSASSTAAAARQIWCVGGAAREWAGRARASGQGAQ